MTTSEKYKRFDAAEHLETLEVAYRALQPGRLLQMRTQRTP